MCVDEKYIFFMTGDDTTLKISFRVLESLKQYAFAGNIKSQMISQLLLLDSNAFQINQSNVRDLSMNSIFHQVMLSKLIVFSSIIIDYSNSYF